jgi:hypothetical protein
MPIRSIRVRFFNTKGRVGNAPQYKGQVVNPPLQSMPICSICVRFINTNGRVVNSPLQPTTFNFQPTYFTSIIFFV